MLTEQEYLFETKIELFCKINNFQYANIIKIMLLKHENLINKIIYMYEQKENDKILSSDELKLITKYYNQNLDSIKERIRLLCLIANIDKIDLEKEIMNSQDLINRLIRHPIEKYIECLNRVNKFNINDVNTEKIRLDEAMKFLNKNSNDSIVKKHE